MAISVVMPALEMAQETGKIISWLKQEGDTITKGEPLLEIETDKIVVEIEAAADGVLAGVKSREGAEVPVGQTIAWIVAPGEAVPADSEVVVPAARTMTAPVAAPVSSQTAAPAPEKPSSGGGGARISPKARRIAQERGVDLSKVIGTGPDGSITGEDVLKAAEAPAPPPAPATVDGAAHHPKHHREADGRTNHAELDPRAAFFPGARSRRQRTRCSAQATGTRQVFRH